MNRALSTAFGLVMIASAAVQADDAAVIAAGAAVLAVLVGNAFRPAATLAVLAAAATISRPNAVDNPRFIAAAARCAGDRVPTAWPYRGCRPHATRRCRRRPSPCRGT